MIIHLIFQQQPLFNKNPEELMRQKPYISRLLLLLCLPLVWSCSSIQPNTSGSQLTSNLSSTNQPESARPNLLQGQEDPELTSAYDSQDEDISPPDLEATASQEIKDLQQMGAWEDGVAMTPKGTVIESDFPIVINRQVEYYLDLFQNQQRKAFSGWLTRSGRYLPMIRQQLAEAGLPQDLAYLAMIESGFKPNAFSSASATGLWQFMAPTANRFGLQINSYVDERRDAHRSTLAAINYLSTLYSQFGKWYVTVAAYNAGEGRINNGLQKYNCDSFWDLAKEDYLPLETKRYVPQLIAAIMIAKYPQDYGFDNIQYDQPLAFEKALVPPRTELAAVAVAANTSEQALYDLNRHLTKKQAPPGIGSYELRVPPGTARLIASNLPRVHATVATRFKDHVVRSRDTINKICAKYNINKITLLKANNLRKAKLVAGTILRIPYQTAQYALLSERELQQLAATNKNPQDVTTHKVKAGDSISKIAARYGSSTREIMALNNLPSKHVLKIGQELTIARNDFAPSVPQSLRVAKKSPTKGKKREIIASRSKTPAKKKVQAAHYRVKSGDNLWTIAQQFDLSPEDLKKWNNLDGNQIAPGLKLIIKTKS